MGEEEKVEAVAEQPQDQAQEHANDQQQEEDKQVPLKALQAERRKRQEAEYQSKWLQEQLQTVQTAPQTQQEPEDGDELLTKSDFSRMTQSQLVEFKRQTLEESFLEQNPNAMEAIETELPEILKKKPWLAHAINNSKNRYATAFEVIKDYKPKNDNVRNRIAENSSKPGSPATVGKGGTLAKDFGKMSNTEFREYRKQVRSQR